MPYAVPGKKIEETIAATIAVAVDTSLFIVFLNGSISININVIKGNIVARAP
jgi:hypothetical protein